MWSVVDWVSEDVVARFRDEAQALALAADKNAHEPLPELVVSDCYGNVIEVGDTVTLTHENVERTGTVYALLDARTIEVRLPNGARLLKQASTVEYRPFD
jgi:hypothetical protein